MVVQQNFDLICLMSKHFERLDSHLHTAVYSWMWGWRSRSPPCLCGGVWCQKTHGPERWASVHEVAWENRSTALESYPEPPPLSPLHPKNTAAKVFVFAATLFVFVCVGVCSPEGLTEWSEVSVGSCARNMQIKGMKWFLKVNVVNNKAHSGAVLYPECGGRNSVHIVTELR